MSPTTDKSFAVHVFDANHPGADMKNGWQTKPLGELCRFIDYRGKTPEKTESGLRLITAKNVKMGFLQTDPLEFVHPDTYEGWMTRGIPKVGDVLFTTEAPLANVCQLDTEERVVFAQRIIILQPADSFLDRTFLKYLLLSDDAQQRIHEKGTGATVKGIKASLLKTVEIGFPRLAEQRRIVGILDEAFEGLATAKANAEQNLQNARALFESHLQAVFTQLRSAHPVRRLSDLCERITKGSSPTWQGMAYVDRPGVLFVTSENVHENRLVVNTPKYVEERFNEKEKRSILMFGDVLTNLVGASIGRTAVYDLHDVANINQAVGVIRCHSDKIHNHYLMYFFNSPVMKAFFHANEVNNARANISLTFVSELEVPLPPVESQKAVVGSIREYHQHCQRLESLYQRKLAALDELKKSLLHRAFSGQL